MKNQLKINALKQPIYAADIYQTLDLLEQQLKLYRQSERGRKNVYHIHQEFDAISRVLSDLKLRIKDLTKDD